MIFEEVIHLPIQKKYKVYCRNSSYYHHQFFMTNILVYCCCSVTKVLSNLRCHGLYVAYSLHAGQASLSSTVSWRLLKFMSIKSVMLSNHLILWCPLLLLPSIFPSIWVFSNELVLCIRWPKYWSFSFSISLSSEYSGLISFRIDWFDLPAVPGIHKMRLLKFWWVCKSPENLVKMQMLIQVNLGWSLRFWNYNNSWVMLMLLVHRTSFEKGIGHLGGDGSLLRMAECECLGLWWLETRLQESSKGRKF